jgi:hypothetical protein
MSYRFAYFVLCAGLVMECAPLGRAQDMPILVQDRPVQTLEPGVSVMPGGGQDVPIVLQARQLQTQEAGVSVVQGGRKDMGFQFVSAEPALSTSIVKGAPYSLEATIDTEQTLADGNRIVHHQAVQVYRDSDGRTRREETMAAIGPWAASGTPPTIITIQDPVSGATYSLDPQNKIATRLPAGRVGQVRIASGHAAGIGIMLATPPDASNSIGPITAFSAGQRTSVVVQDGMAVPAEKPEESSESLGRQTIAGVSAEGTRLTTTIPAESMGNERPIEITRERWFSPDLQIILRSRQSDPRFGVTTYEVTKLDRANPAHALFEVPRDYQIRKMPEPPLPPLPPK